jgi:hypothetical protein
LAQFVNWEAPFLVASGCSARSSYLRIDPSERIFGKPVETTR